MVILDLLKNKNKDLETLWYNIKAKRSYRISVQKKILINLFFCIITT